MLHSRLGGENNWWCLPIGLIPRVLRHAQVCRAHGTMGFWPLMCPFNTGYFAQFVRDARELPMVAKPFLP